MSNRTAYVGDAYPPALFQISDEAGVLNLSGTTITVKWEGISHRFSGPGLAIYPPINDADGIHKWNCQYNFAAGDLASPDVYVPFVIVIFPGGPPPQQETFPDLDTLTVLAAPL